MSSSRQEAVLTALLIAAGILPFSAKADNYYPKGEEQLINTLYTHLYLSPKSLPSFKEIKTAAVCFITDTSECGGNLFSSSEDVDTGGTPDNYNPENTNRCIKAGYVKSCSTGMCMDGSCLYDSSYGKCIAESCPYNSSSTCTGAVVGTNACGGSCRQCCSDSCPSGSKDYTGSYASTTECGTTCYNCNM